mmetsp:Transcript_1012/g.1826  ORF Transcript_1012/g.1826 Transcript_1012/m.1826 type:complete len:256 (+) Transcript_1012:1579-2346(+)
MQVPGHDGAEIPLNLYYKKNNGFNLNRKNRVLLEAYGAYGINMGQGFSIARTCAMERGWVIADACVRGGGEKGIQWHEDGKLFNKPNSVLDLISCSEYLISQRITHPNLLACKGQSAGAALIAHACLNLRPELYRACILNSPFLDVLNSLLDPSLALSETDYLELGNPLEDANIYNLIKSYCPYQNLSNQEHPAVLLQTSIQDQRVPIWGTLKFVQRLRDLTQKPQRFPEMVDQNILVRLIDEEGTGHFGSVDNE